MAGITLAQAESRLEALLNAHDAVLSGQSYSIGNRALTRANLADIERGIEIWEKRVARLSRGGISIRGGTPL